MEVSPFASSCNSDGCVVAGITVVGFHGAFVVTVVLLLTTGSGRRAAPFFFLGRGITTVAVVVSLPAAVAHAKFSFCGFVRVSSGGNVLVAVVSREFSTTRQWWFSFSYGGGVLVFVFVQQLAERERGEMQRGEGEEGLTSFVP
ncbi:hypothetical protein DEO72_LG4g1165 [Vigna unguiculata]|uniref:Transmembrane protein n=1 Tax=Vigna unguiculata TaxID=3917 RepID=A0A4D6LNY1_VIGUN|nr:hypothetical protein DEO72_LG4g1165 [Vigna unguiculata]